MAPPRFSVIVPTRDRETQLEGCLQALAGLAYPRERYEVIVVDDGGSLPDVAVDGYRDRIAISVVHQPHAGQSAARNRGAARAAGSYLAFTDDDCRPARDWLTRLDETFAEADGDRLVGGRIETAPGQTLYSHASDLLTTAAYAYFGTRDGGFFSTSNLAVPTARFRTLKGFDERLSASEDRELAVRWARQGLGLEFSPGAIVFHAHRLTFGSFCAQRFRFGRGARYHELALEALGGTAVRDAGFYGYLLRYPFSVLPPGRAALIAALFVVAQAANAAGYAWQRWLRW